MSDRLIETNVRPAHLGKDVFRQYALNLAAGAQPVFDNVPLEPLPGYRHERFGAGAVTRPHRPDNLAGLLTRLGDGVELHRPYRRSYLLTARIGSDGDVALRVLSVTLT